LLNLIMFENWFGRWWDTPVAVLPSLIGFTLGGYAILLAFGDEEFKSVFAGATTKNKDSPYVIVSATFMHFIVVQVIALLIALAAEPISVSLECKGVLAGSRFLEDWNVPTASTVALA
jgi:hypothetical protein